ncbi:hypothetical protein [Penguinpox virus 2]|nr:hypothetical protein [Penguinpox virus 2]
MRSNMYLVINILTSCILFMILSNAYYIDISGSGDSDNSKHKNMFSVIDSYRFRKRKRKR